MPSERVMYESIKPMGTEIHMKYECYFYGKNSRFVNFLRVGTECQSLSQQGEERLVGYRGLLNAC